MSKQIQEQFGERVMEAFTEFARSDLKLPVDLVKDEFAHVQDKDLREALANVHYGVRWIYKLGLALLVRNEERAAHIRAQIVDYTSICEALISYCIGHAIKNQYTKGTRYLRDKSRNLQWPAASIERELRQRSLWWLLAVAEDFEIIDARLAKDLDWLRKERNAVHIRQRVALGSDAYLNQSRKAFELATRTIQSTKVWKAIHQ